MLFMARTCTHTHYDTYVNTLKYTQHTPGHAASLDPLLLWSVSSAALWISKTIIIPNTTFESVYHLHTPWVASNHR